MYVSAATLKDMIVCNTYLTQQEELVSTFLSVVITGALHLLQVNSIQLELLLSHKVKVEPQVTFFFFSFLFYILIP